MLTLKLVPHPKNPEKIQIFEHNGHQHALVDRDTFWDPDGDGGDIYDRLSSGETVVVELRRVTTPNH